MTTTNTEKVAAASKRPVRICPALCAAIAAASAVV